MADRTGRLTVLNTMAAPDLPAALDRHVEWGLRHLDLKSGIFGKEVADLTDEEAGRATDLARERGLSVYCLSTVLFGAAIEDGGTVFRRQHLAPVNRIIEIARILKPRLVRLLAAKTTRREELADSVAYIRAEQPWILSLYREAIDRLRDAGLEPTIENETHGCILATPDEVLGFFEALDRPGRAALTWDVQNLWQMGGFPSLEVYRRLRPLIGYVHLKGGQRGKDDRFRWASCLEDASWPVVEVTRAVLADGVSPVLCLNPSHGEWKPGCDRANEARRNIEFLRRKIPEVR